MAKKTVATLHEGSKDGRAYTKVIKMVKSPKTGAYIFDEQMVPNLFCDLIFFEIVCLFGK